MRRRLTGAVVVIIALFAGAQLIRPGRANPSPNPTHTIQSQLGDAPALAAVVSRSCGDCHSNTTAWSAWPWYARMAPVSWVLARGVGEGRKAVDFSEWAGYGPRQRRALLTLSCRDATEGKMPMSAYMLLKPEAKLSPQDVATICAAAREGGADQGQGGQP